HGLVEHERGGLPQVVNLDVSNLADDLDPTGIAAIAGNAHHSPDRVCVAEEVPGHAFIDDGNFGGSVTVVRCKLPTAHDRRLHRPEIGWANRLDVHWGQIFA